MNSFLMKFVFRINGGINIYFVFWANRVVQKQYVVINSGLAAVASFCSWLFCSKKCRRGSEDSIASLYFSCYKVNEEMR